MRGCFFMASAMLASSMALAMPRAAPEKPVAKKLFSGNL